MYTEISKYCACRLRQCGNCVVITNMQFGGIADSLGTVGQVVLGIFIGLVLNMIVQWKSTYDSKMNLRRALIAELETIWIKLERIPDDKTNITDIIQDLPRTVYESNASQIGSLSKEEVRAVTRFYSITSGYHLGGRHEAVRQSVQEIISEADENIRDVLLDDYEAILEKQQSEIDDGKLKNLKLQRKAAVETLESNLEDSILLYIILRVPSRTRARIWTFINKLRTPKNWEEIPENQCVTLVSIAHLHGNAPFSHDEFQEKALSRDIDERFGSKTTVDTREQTLVALRIKNLLKRVDGKYKINTSVESDVLTGYYSQLDEDVRENINISWG